MVKKYAMGYATKAGLEIRSEEGGRIKVKARAMGQIRVPDAQDLRDKFLAVLKAGDIVLSPTGPNYGYLAGIAGRGAQVFWIDPGTFAKAANGSGAKAKVLFRLFAEQPGLFYEYQPMDARIAALRLAVGNWLNLERTGVAVGNGYSKLLQRERDEFFLAATPDRDGWIAAEVERERKRMVGQLRQRGVALTAEQLASLGKKLSDQAAALYGRYFDPAAEADEKTSKKAQIELIRERLEFFGIEELEADAEARVRAILAGLPEAALFEGLVGEALKTRAQLLAYMRNPLFYPNARALAAYAGVGTVDGGQAARRQHGERSTGSPEFRCLLVFGFADKYWQKPGFFQNLYYAYKRHQYLVYWPLIEMTAELWRLLGKKAEEDEDGEEDEAEVDTAAIAADRVRDFVRRLAALDLPMIGRNAKVREEIAALEQNPDPKRLWRLFSKAHGKPGVPAGGNLQMTPKRIEAQTKRLLGTVLLTTVYYRWLALLGRPLPLADDFIFCKQWRFVTGRDGTPESFDHQVVLEYFRRKGDLLARTRQLPAEVAEKLVPKAERRAAAEQPTV